MLIEMFSWFCFIYAKFQDFSVTTKSLSILAKGSYRAVRVFRVLNKERFNELWGYFVFYSPSQLEL